MQFEQQTITILTPEYGKVDVEAMVAVGTGLAYHHNLNRDKQPMDTYGVSHIRSGYCICGHGYRAAQFSEDAAKRFIELILAFADWNLSADDLWKTNRSAMTERLKKAYAEALQVGEIKQLARNLTKGA